MPVVKHFVDKTHGNVGTIVNGKDPRDVNVLKEKEFYIRNAIERNFGFFEGYMDEEWTCQVN